jgi:hypothetical protein
VFPIACASSGVIAARAAASRSLGRLLPPGQRGSGASDDRHAVGVVQQVAADEPLRVARVGASAALTSASGAS